MASPHFYFMHFMPYPALPADYDDRGKYPSSWVELPNELYDPATGTELYHRYIGELVLADRLGFDGVVVNEHHSTTFSMMAAPNLIASILARETEKAKICVWGTPPTLTNPVRLAEEYAMIDVISGGRLEVAFPLGTGMEYWVNSVNPARARERFRESVEIILKCWTEDGPGRHVGRHFTYRYLNPWVRPVQKPHPKCYVVGTGSPETVEFATDLGFGYSVAFSTHQAHLDLIDTFRKQAKAKGRTAAPDQLPLGVMAYVADTDEQAVEEYLPHIRWYFERGARTTGRYLTPPGYVSLAQYEKRASMARTSHGVFDWDKLTANNRVVAGSPETVAAKIAGWLDDAGSSLVNCQLHLGDMPHWKAVKNLTLFANEVIPRVRAAAPRQAARPATAAAEG